MLSISVSFFRRVRPTLPLSFTRAASLSSSSFRLFALGVAIATPAASPSFFTRLDSTRRNSTRPDPARLASPRLGSTRLDSIRLYSTRLDRARPKLLFLGSNTSVSVPPSRLPPFSSFFLSIFVKCTRRYRVSPSLVCSIASAVVGTGCETERERE